MQPRSSFTFGNLENTLKILAWRIEDDRQSCYQMGQQYALCSLFQRPITHTQDDIVFDAVPQGKVADRS